MSIESHNTSHAVGDVPRHTDVSFEAQDIKTGTIYGYIIALGLAVVVSMIICIFILKFTRNFAATTEMPPVKEAMKIIAEKGLPGASSSAAAPAPAAEKKP